MRVVISLGGSVAFTEADPTVIEGHAAGIERLLDDGHEVAVVVGGGPIAREYIGAGRALGADEVSLDELGIAVTRLNARLIIEALDGRALPWPATTYAEAGQALRQGDVPVLGGVAPAQTTDAVSAATAEYVDADLLVYATSIDGVYSGDPAVDDGAERFDRIDVGDLLEVIAGIELNAGSQSPVDLLAAKIIQRAGLRTIVLDGEDPTAIEHAVRTGEHDGTDVIVDGMREPAEW